MNNLKKIGLTALAGTLAAATAHAGELTVSGTADINYQTHGDGSSTGNPFTQSQTLSFSGSGDLDNGMTVNYSSAFTGSAFTASSIVIDMGDGGSIGLYNNLSDGGGISAYQDKIPTAGEQVWDDTGVSSHGGSANGITDMGSRANLAYNNTFGSMTVSADWARNTTGAEGSVVLAYADLIDGMNIGYGVGEKQESAATEVTTDLETLYVTYAAGPVTFGVQRSEVTPAVATGASAALSKKTRDHVGASFAVNENLSVSVGRSDLDYGSGSTLLDQTDSGISASYTMGATTIGFVHNKTQDAAGVANSDFDVTEIKLTFAF
jgi:outer membrane protein OmpU